MHKPNLKFSNMEAVAAPDKGLHLEGSKVFGMLSTIEGASDPDFRPATQCSDIWIVV